MSHNGSDELVRVLDCLLEEAVAVQNPSFVKLVAQAELDPGRDFVGAVLRNMDFREEDLRGFDFSYADLTGTDFRRANVEGVCFAGADLTGVIGLPQRAENDPKDQPPLDFNQEVLRTMILAGETPPESWRPFVHTLDL